MVSFVVLNPS